MKKLTFILSITLTLSAFAQVPSYVPTNGLVGWWPFNGNANDESGNGNNGTVNGASLTTDRFGNSNSAYNFNGSSSYIQVSSNSNLQLTNNYSINGWFNADVFFYTNNSDRSIISKVQSTGWHGGYEVMVGGNTNDIAHTGNVGGNNFVLESTGYSINTWYMFTTTYDGNSMKLYMNGVLVSSQPTTGSLQTSGQPLFFGRRDGGIQGYFDGKIDDIGIWNRALTPQEVAALYNGCQQSISVQPLSQTASFNDNVQFTAASSDPNATYQWQTNVGLGFQNLSDAGQYSGTSTNTLNVSNVGVLNVNQEFRCVIQSGACTDTTDIATLQVCGSILSQPSNESVLLNANAQFTFSSTDPNATYQWQTNLGLGFQNLTDAGQYSGSSTNTLNVSNVALSNNNQQFRCIIASGSCSDTSDVALLTVVNNVGLVEQNQMQLFVYPNPTSSIITIENPQGLNSNFVLVDARGREVLQGSLDSEFHSFQISHLTSGIYTIIFEQKSINEVKIIKE